MTGVLTQRGGYKSGGPVTTHNVTNPGGFASGDVLVMIWSAPGGTGNGLTPPAGWTLRARLDTGTDLTMFVYTKTATGSEGASWQFVASPVMAATVDILSVAGGDPQSPFASLTLQANATDTSAAFPDYTTVGYGAHALLACACAANVTGTVPTGYTEAYDDGDSTANPQALQVNTRVHGVAGGASGNAETLSATAITVTMAAVVSSYAGQVEQLIETVCPDTQRVEIVAR